MVSPRLSTPSIKITPSLKNRAAFLLRGKKCICNSHKRINKKWRSLPIDTSVMLQATTTIPMKLNVQRRATNRPITTYTSCSLPSYIKRNSFSLYALPVSTKLKSTLLPLEELIVNFPIDKIDPLLVALGLLLLTVSCFIPESAVVTKALTATHTKRYSTNFTFKLCYCCVKGKIYSCGYVYTAC